MPESSDAARAELQAGEPQPADKPVQGGEVVSPVTFLLAAYRQMLLSLFVSAVILSGLLMLVFRESIFDISNADDAPSPVLVAILAGSLGAVFSSLVRVYNFDDLPEAIVRDELKQLGSPYLIVYSVVPMVIGAISAAILYVVISSGILQGPLFPEFACKAAPPNKCPDFIDLIKHWSPKEAPDYAKIILWGFVAGFAERLVPNTMDNLASSAKVTAK